MSEPDLDMLERIVGHRFHDRALLQRAVTHSSIAFEQNLQRELLAPHPGVTEDNEKLEFLGDAVLGLLVAHALYTAFPHLEEGSLTRLRATLVSRHHLGQVAQAMQMGDYLRLGRGEERSGGRQKSVLLANALEALVAALYLDGGLDPARDFVQSRVVDPFADRLYRGLERGESIGDHKSALQQILQARGIAPPEYAVKAQTGPDHRKRFLVELVIPQTIATSAITAQGSGTTKKRAEQEAARLACQQLIDQASLPVPLKSAMA